MPLQWLATSPVHLSPDQANEAERDEKWFKNNFKKGDSFVVCEEDEKAR